MAHIREVRPQAREVKFVVDADKAVMIRQWARTHLDPDPHGGGQFGDEYRTTSVYFDTTPTTSFTVAARSGAASIGSAGTATSRRFSSNARCASRRCSPSGARCLSLAALSRLTEPAVDADWPGYWFHRRVTARRLQPVCQVAYSGWRGASCATENKSA